MMEAQTGGVEPVTINDILSLATWSRERSSEELQGFIESRHATLDDIDLGI